jgi:hypothetical protein
LIRPPRWALMQLLNFGSVSSAATKDGHGLTASGDGGLA